MPTLHADDGTQLSYDRRGTTSPAVVFMHGWAGSSAYFDPLVEQLDLSQLCAITYDMRGHGRSGDAASWTLDEIADDAVAVADAAAASTFVLVGFSMSGKFAQYVACRHPERVRGLMLVAGAFAGPMALPDELVHDWYARAGNAERMADLMRSYAAVPIDAAALATAAGHAARARRAALEGSMRAVACTSFAERVAGLRTPTVVVGGLHDAMFAPDALRTGVAAPLPGARLALLDCGHEIPLERPGELAALLEAFLAGLGGGSSRPADG